MDFATVIAHGKVLQNLHAVRETKYENVAQRLASTTERRRERR